jgi:hypothetical protein
VRPPAVCDPAQSAGIGNLRVALVEPLGEPRLRAGELMDAEATGLAREEKRKGPERRP